MSKLQTTENIIIPANSPRCRTFEVEAFGTIDKLSAFFEKMNETAEYGRLGYDIDVKIIKTGYGSSTEKESLQDDAIVEEIESIAKINQRCKTCD